MKHFKKIAASMIFFVPLMVMAKGKPTNKVHPRDRHKTPEVVEPEVPVITSDIPVEPSIVTLLPRAINNILTNPGIGIERFHSNYLSIDQYPVSSVEYNRFYRSELESTKGVYNFALIDNLIKITNQEGGNSTIALRFMVTEAPNDGSKIPQGLINEGIAGVWTADGKTFNPDLSDVTFIYYVKRLLNAFSERYDGNPRLSTMNIGIVGSWGRVA